MQSHIKDINYIRVNEHMNNAWREVTTQGSRMDVVAILTLISQIVSNLRKLKAKFYR